MRKISWLALSLVGMSGLVSCSGGTTNTNNPPPTPAYNTAGVWKGTLQNQNNNNYTLNLTATLNDSNGTITGTASFDLDPNNLAQVSGTRDLSTNVSTLKMNTYIGLVTLQGTFAGNTYSGTYTAAAGGAGPVALKRQQ